MKTVTGSLLDLTSGTIMHQVNAQGATGGVAGALRRKWPAAFGPYLKACVNPRQAMGTTVVGEAEPGLWIGHVFGQYYPGPNTEMSAVREALRSASHKITHTVYAPYKMGCGLGGGDWDEYLSALVTFFPVIIIVQRPEDAE